MMIIVNHPLHLDWFVWMMVMLVLVFGDGLDGPFRLLCNVNVGWVAQFRSGDGSDGACHPFCNVNVWADRFWPWPAGARQ